jgi:RimJ/RimL family protein N-acetyltransferase
VKSLAATCCSRLALLERSVEAPFPELGGLPQLDFGLLGSADAEEYAALVPGASAHEVRDRLRAGEIGFAERDRGRLVAVSWAAFGRVAVPYLRGTLALPPDDALVHGLFVAPDMRGKHVSLHGAVCRLNWLREAGYRRMVAAILPENVAAFGAPDWLGFRRIGTAYGVGIGAFRRVIVVRRKRPANRGLMPAAGRRSPRQRSASERPARGR